MFIYDLSIYPVSAAWCSRLVLHTLRSECQILDRVKNGGSKPLLYDVILQTPIYRGERFALLTPHPSASPPPSPTGEGLF